MKSNISLCIDTELILDAKDKVENLSKLFNDFLIDYLPSVDKVGSKNSDKRQIRILKASLKIAEKRLKKRGTEIEI